MTWQEDAEDLAQAEDRAVVEPPPCTNPAGSPRRSTDMADTIAGRYRLSRVIGSGGMSRVWAATDELLDRPVAVKEILPVPGLPEDLWTRTLQEARAAARLAHPNVVRVYDVLFGDGRPWIIMEYLTCRSLEAAVRARGPLPPPEAARMALSVLDGLAAAHRAGVLHRDVKPANVLLTDDGRVLLGDFGIAVFDALPLSAGPLVASPAYVAPERFRDGLSTAHGDLWSFGAMLYYAVEGRPPFSRPTTTSVLGALTSSPVDPVRLAGPLEPVIEGLLRRDPGERLTATRTRLLLTSVLSADAAPSPAASPSLPPPAAVAEPASGAASFVGRPALVRGRSPLRRLRTWIGRPGFPADRPAGSPAQRPDRAPDARTATTRARGLLAAGAAALLGGAAAAVLLSLPSSSSTSSSTGAPAGCADPASAPSLPATGATPIVGGPEPDGSVLHTDPQGFRVALPADWLRSTDAASVCFVAPSGAVRLTVTAAPADGGREFSYDAAGRRWHTEQVRSATGHLLSWTAGEADFPASRSRFDTIAGTFAAL
ncbi:protein kinase [Dactylosporangium sucinum]|uniref:non-specific serine/threonine protein kinase n=1 Tax=Dactylosporangium sucinum TaxID=1424081 RepID=A0A917X4H0_9ACTN|nr:serine/threonine-protein kinase [Dactylosporangium sucinum]GGM71562.1 hypothetical protein GCM10007977_086760 [Dactylosporangium sucinum]